MVLEKNKNWPGIKPSNPDRLIFIRVPEAEAQLTALHNGEIQIASSIPPHMVARLESKPGIKARVIPSVEQFFIGMNSKYAPWDNKLARRAVAHAINKKLIVEQIYRGQATILDGPIGIRAIRLFTGDEGSVSLRSKRRAPCWRRQASSGPR